MKKAKILTAVLALALITFSAGAVCAQESIFLSPGQSTVKEFYVYEVGTYTGAIITTLSFADPAGSIDISVAADPDRTFGSEMKFSVLGIGLTLDTTNPIPFISGSATVPTANTIATSIAVNSNFGIVLIGVKIDSIMGTVTLPVEFTATISVSAAAAAAE